MDKEVKDLEKNDSNTPAAETAPPGSERVQHGHSAC